MDPSLIALRLIDHAAVKPNQTLMVNMEEAWDVARKGRREKKKERFQIHEALLYHPKSFEIHRPTTKTGIAGFSG